MDDDGFFSDDDLDNIPDNFLADLERNAISSTQAKAKANATSRPPQSKPKYNRGVLNAPQTSKNIPWRPPQPRNRLPAVQAPAQAPPPSAPDPPSSDYGFDDEDVIDLDEPSMIIQPASGPPTRVPSDHHQPSSQPKPGLSTQDAYAQADAELGAQQWRQAPHLQPRADVSALEARIAALEAEQATLRQQAEDARSAALAKQGEIAIVRSNQEKATKEFERRIEVMRKLHADEAAKQKTEIEAAKKERERMDSENRFLQHDLAQEAERAKRVGGPMKGPGKARQNGQITPRKAKRPALGDGFDDDEMVTISPSKSKEKSREHTPKAGAKRKRPVNDSPAKPLAFTQPQPASREVSGEQLQASMQTMAIEPTISQDDRRYDFIQRVLNHCPWEGHERTIEALTKSHFPSTTTMSISSILLDDLADPTTAKQSESMPLRLCEIMLKLWSRCLDEKHYAPLHLIIDMIRVTLLPELSSVSAALIEQAIPLCIKSIDLVAVPTAQASTTPSYHATLDRKAQAKVAEEVDADEILDFLLSLARAAELSTERIACFWHHIDYDFMLCILHKAQPINHLTLALRILATSVLPTSFGTVSEKFEKQAANETNVVERLVSLLLEQPKVPKDEEPYSDEEIASLRVEILLVLRAVCQSDHGGQALAMHRNVIGRLVRFLDAQINRLYMIPPSLGKAASENEANLHDLVIQTVNATTRLLYHLLHTYASMIDLRAKLATIHGGYHKFLIALTRLAFSEQLVFEQGIEEAVVEAAHSILDNVLSPEEGEAVVKAVETPKGTRSTTTRVDSQETEDEDVAMSAPG